MSSIFAYPRTMLEPPWFDFNTLKMRGCFAVDKPQSLYLTLHAYVISRMVADLGQCWQLDTFPSGQVQSILRRLQVKVQQSGKEIN